MSKYDLNPDFCLPRNQMDPIQAFILMYNSPLDIFVPIIVGMALLFRRPRRAILIDINRFVVTVCFTSVILRIAYLLFC